MYSFLNDYSESAHPAVLQALVDSNMEQSVGYGMDEHCQHAIALIREKLQNNSVDIHFIPGGTAANVLAAAAFLRPHQGIIAAESGHIHAHECGSMEETGHKILAIPTPDGKLTPELVDRVYRANQEEHCPSPKFCYISNSTELGTVYNKAELQALHDYCQEKKILFFIDGARMGSALACSDLCMADYPKLCDAFYIGGTKNGLLLGEALVIVREELKEDFRRHMKQRGLMLAKGKVLGVQFETLFTGDLYMELARHANACMDILREGIAKLGYRFLCDSPSNQLFPIFPLDILEKINEKYLVMDNSDEGQGYHSIRMVTSWATDPQQCKAFVEDLAAWSK